MTTYATAERARQRAIRVLRGAGLDAEADRLAALPPITDAASAAAILAAAYAAAYAVRSSGARDATKEVRR